MGYVQVKVKVIIMGIWDLRETNRGIQGWSKHGDKEPSSKGGFSSLLVEQTIYYETHCTRHDAIILILAIYC